MSKDRYPSVVDPAKVGEYPALSFAGGGYVWDDVLEYRVWCHVQDGAEDLMNGDDYYYAFESFIEALKFQKQTQGATEPLALIIQKEYLDEPSPGEYVHVKEERITEWPVEFLSRKRRTPNTIPDFLNSTDPDRLSILRAGA